MGSQVVCDMKGMLMGEITPDDNIQYLMVDSDIPAMENMIEASRDGIGLNATEIISIYRPNLENSSGKRHQGESGASESCELDA